MSEIGRKCGWVKRKLRAGQPLTGELIESALELVPAPGREGDKDSDTWASMARKLNSGESLSDYEQHLLLDVFMLHARLAASETERLKREG
jgi:hypothetical protein